MILSDRSIREAIAEGRVTIDPFDDALVQPCSVDVRCDPRFRVFHDHVRAKYNAQPGYITMNLPRLLDALERLGIDNPVNSSLLPPSLAPWPASASDEPSSDGRHVERWPGNGEVAGLPKATVDKRFQ